MNWFKVGPNSHGGGRLPRLPREEKMRLKVESPQKKENKTNMHAPPTSSTNGIVRFCWCCGSLFLQRGGGHGKEGGKKEFRETETKKLPHQAHHFQTRKGKRIGHYELKFWGRQHETCTGKRICEKKKKNGASGPIRKNVDSLVTRGSQLKKKKAGRPENLLREGKKKKGQRGCLFPR